MGERLRRLSSARNVPSSCRGWQHSQHWQQLAQQQSVSQRVAICPLLACDTLACTSILASNAPADQIRAFVAPNPKHRRHKINLVGDGCCYMLRLHTNLPAPPLSLSLYLYLSLCPLSIIHYPSSIPSIHISSISSYSGQFSSVYANLKYVYRSRNTNW